jgi:hypothetical protein
MLGRCSQIVGVSLAGTTRHAFRATSSSCGMYRRLSNRKARDWLPILHVARGGRGSIPGRSSPTTDEAFPDFNPTTLRGHSRFSQPFLP